MKAGFAAAEMAVPEGSFLIGYEGAAARPVQGVHDPLYARVLLLEQMDRRFALVSCDLLAVDPAMVDRLAKRAGEFGVAPDDFFMVATHTHSGFGGYFSADPRFGSLLGFIFGNPNATAITAVEDAVMAALKESCSALCACSVSAVCQQSPGIGTDRNHADLPGDPFLTLLAFQTSDGRKALLYNTACHPTILNAENVRASADFPGCVADELAESGYAASLFLNGSAGDVSTRFTRQGSGFSEVRRLGSLLARQIISAAASLKPQQGVRLETSGFVCALKVRRVEIAQQAQEVARQKDELAAAQQRGGDPATLRLLQSRYEGAMLGMLYAQHQPTQQTLPVRVQFLHIGDYVLGFYPVELFSALTNPLRARFGSRFVPVGYAGGYLGYLPDSAIAETDNYEKHTTIFDYQQGARLMEATARHLEENDGIQRQ